MVAGQGQVPSVKSEKLAGPLCFPVHMLVGTRVSVCRVFTSQGMCRCVLVHVTLWCPRARGRVQQDLELGWLHRCLPPLGS